MIAFPACWPTKHGLTVPMLQLLWSVKVAFIWILMLVINVRVFLLTAALAANNKFSAVRKASM